MTPRPLSPSDIARTALKRLTELGLPPTPENYARFYYDAAGTQANVLAPAPAPATEPVGPDLKLVASVHDIVSDAAVETGTLADLIGGHTLRIQNSLDDLRITESRDELLPLIHSLISTTSTMHGSVEESRGSLMSLRQTLSQMRDDIAASRHSLERDPLTGAQNRQGLDFMLAREVSKARVAGGRLTIALFDLDNFKPVNDRYGHAVGDKVLIHLANVAKAVLRGNDVLVRFGGEEFLIILPDTDIHGATYLIERLKTVFRNNPVIHQQDRLQVTFSAGVAQLQADENGHALILRADQALYAAKGAGRNTIVVSDHTVPLS